MAKAKATLDQFPNKAVVEITMSAANTLTFKAIQFGVGLFQGTAMVLQKIEYHPIVATVREIVAATDSLALALTSTDQLASLSVKNAAIIDIFQIFGVAADTERAMTPFERDFTQLQGGGIILPPNPLYLAMSTGGFANPGEAAVKLYFTFRDLIPSDYIELIQSQIPANF
jgi:hypothetical protein